MPDEGSKLGVPVGRGTQMDSWIANNLPEERIAETVKQLMDRVSTVERGIKELDDESYMGAPIVANNSLYVLYATLVTSISSVDGFFYGKRQIAGRGEEVDERWEDAPLTANKLVKVDIDEDQLFPEVGETVDVMYVGTYKDPDNENAIVGRHVLPRRSPEEWFVSKLTTISNTYYGFKEQTIVSSGWTDADSPRFGGVANNYAREANANPIIPIGSKVLTRRGYGQEWSTDVTSNKTFEFLYGSEIYVCRIGTVTNTLGLYMSTFYGWNNTTMDCDILLGNCWVRILT